MPLLPRMFKDKKGKQSIPTGAIADAFAEYINNEIPTRLIDTSKLKFVSREDVFRVFQDEIANVTEERIKERMESSGSDPFATYGPRREEVLRQIIQEIVKYDVLSHRRDDVAREPSYQDISSGKKRASKFQKLDQFCKTSKQLGRKLAWVDTCCIDRANAVELSEAINATYKWYANAYLCIAYLAESTSYADWASESWFTRGWTLPELLAPKRLKFYNRTWQPFTPPEIDNDRRSDDIIHHLEQVSGIPKAVLIADNSLGVQGHTLWQKMSWASKRRTTHIEDVAYSLVGLFYVSRPISYGEGQRAFSSLVEAIAAKKPSWDVFAWCGKPSVEHFALPLSPASYPAFEADIGRDRAGVQDFTIAPNRLSLKSLPLILMEVHSVVNPEEPGQPFRVHLRPRSGEEGSLGRYEDLVVECGTTRLNTIRRARQLSACILNHHGARRREQGKLMVGKVYICFLLYSEDEDDDETDERRWMKLATNNLLRITCAGTPDAVTQQHDLAGPNEFTLSLVTTLIRSPDAL